MHPVINIRPSVIQIAKLSHFTLYLLRNLNMRDTKKKKNPPICLAYVNITSSLTNHSVNNAKYGHRCDLQKHPL